MVRPHLPYAALTNTERSTDDQGPIWGYQQAAAYGSRLGRRCAPAISMNGSSASDMWTVEDIPVHLVEAAEVYKPKWSEIPIEFTFSGRAMLCGLVIVWTK
jgi:hypothetical protein